MTEQRRLTDAYRFRGFKPQQKVVGVFGDPKARVIRLKRTQKKLHARRAVNLHQVIMTKRTIGYAIFHAAITEFILNWKYAALSVGNARK